MNYQKVKIFLIAGTQQNQAQKNELLGLAFLGSYLMPFMAIGVLLSVALIGAVILAREKTPEESES